MSLSDAGRFWRRRIATAALLAAATLVSACTVQPLYGPTPSGGTVADTLARITFDPVDNRIAQLVRNKLIFGLTGGTPVADPLYRMRLVVTSQEISLGITREELAPVYSIIVIATYEYSIKNGEIVLRATSRGNASYNRVNQIFANVRARTDAEDKAAGVVADDIRIRVAAATARGTIEAPEPGTVVDVKPANADRVVAAPDPAIRVILLYGPDDGLVAERAQTFVKAVTGASDDPFCHVRLDAAELADDPARLADEAHAVPLFGGRRAISIRAGGNRSIVPALEPILAVPPVDSWIVVLAGELKKSAPLRKLCEASPRSAAIPCYVDSVKDLDRVIDEETRRAGLTITPEARTALRDLLGSDRLASRSEVVKLCLYAAGKGGIEVDDVAAIIGDAAAFAVDEAIDALALGDADGFDRTFRRLLASGTPGFVVGGAAQRHFTQLHQARAAFDDGRPLEAIVGAMRPPVFYQRKAKMERQIAIWPLARIERTLAHLEQAMIDSRFRSAISDEVIGEALTLVAAMGAGLRRS